MKHIKFLHNHKQKILFYCSLFFFVLIGLFVRLHDFGTYPADTNCDEAMAAVEAMALIDNGTDQYGTSFPVYFETWGYGQMNALLIYLLAVTMKLLGSGTTIVRLPMLLFSLAGIAAITWTAWMLFSKETALFVLAFAAINPWHIMLSRWTLESNLFPQCLVFGLALLIYSLKTRKAFYFCLSMICYAISLYAYGVAYAFVPVFLVLTYIYLYRTNIFKISVFILGGICFFSIAWPIIFMMIINFFHLKSVSIGPISIQLFEKTTRTSDLIFSSGNFPAQLLSNLKHFVNIVILQKMDLWWNQLPKIGTMYKIYFPFFLIGCVISIKGIWVYGKTEQQDFQKKGIRVLFFHLFSSLISGLIINNVNVNRINSIFYILILFSAVGIYGITVKKRLVGGIIVILYGFCFLFFGYRYFYSEDRYFLNYTYDKGFEKIILRTSDFQSKPVCISTRLYQAQRKIVETYLKYYLRLPYRYYSGLMDQNELIQSGYEIPYAEKYLIFGDLEKAYSDYKDRCIYVINMRDRDYFDRNLFTVESEDFFSIAIPHSYMNQDLGMGNQTGTD